VRIPTWENWFATTPSTASKRRSDLRIGIPRVLNIWSTHQFWIGFFSALGVERIVFSSQTSEEQGRTFGRGRGTVDCCYPVKCMSGHYGELVFGQKRKIDILFSPMIRSLPSCLAGHVVDSLSCPRVMAGPENIKAGFIRERDVFAQEQIDYISPLVCLAEPRLVPKQLHQSLAGAIPGLTYAETAKAVAAGYAALEQFNQMARGASSEVLAQCAKGSRPCILILSDLVGAVSAHGCIASRLALRRRSPLGCNASPFDISDVWPSSYSGNTNEILWGAKVGAKLPWVTCVIRLTSYECGMDQPTFTPVQQIVEGSGTLFFSFQDLDCTKPAGSVKIRVETIAHYLECHSPRIIREKLARLSPVCPLTAGDTAS
jgi:predicted nucleotide-binding protein (sugar kinase/HSP70/actin superfamily)